MLVALFVTTMAVGGAWASVLDIAASGATAVDADTDAAASGPYVVGSEWLAGQTGAVSVDLGSAVPSPGVVAADRSDILYVPSIDLGLNNVIVISVVNGALAANTDYGLWDLDLGTPAKVADLVDFETNAYGYTKLKFKFNAAATVNDVLVLTEDGLLPAAGNAPELLFTSAQLATGPMTLQVTEAYDDTSLPLEAPKTGTETVAKRASQLSAKVQTENGGAGFVDGNSTSTIDVEAAPSRAKFVAETGNSDTLTPTTSEAAVLVESAIVNNGIIVANAAYTLTLNGNQTAISKVELKDATGSDTDDFTENANNFTLTSTFADNDLTTPDDNVILITVNGTTVVDIANYTVDLVIDPNETGVANQTSLNDALAFAWTVNAMQARIPYMIVETGGDNYTFFMEITNRGANPAEVSLDAVISNADASVNTTETQTNVITLAANSVTIIREADLDTWLTNVDDTQLYRLGLTLTVVAPQNTVDVSAYQLDPSGRTDVPVLYNTNNNGDGRVWQ